MTSAGHNKLNKMHYLNVPKILKKQFKILPSIFLRYNLYTKVYGKEKKIIFFANKSLISANNCCSLLSTKIKTSQNRWATAP